LDINEKIRIIRNKCVEDQKDEEHWENFMDYIHSHNLVYEVFNMAYSYYDQSMTKTQMISELSDAMYEWDI